MAAAQKILDRINGPEFKRLERNYSTNDNPFLFELQKLHTLTMKHENLLGEPITEDNRYLIIGLKEQLSKTINDLYYTSEFNFRRSENELNHNSAFLKLSLNTDETRRFPITEHLHLNAGSHCFSVTSQSKAVGISKNIQTINGTSDHRTDILTLLDDSNIIKALIDGDKKLSISCKRVRPWTTNKRLVFDYEKQEIIVKYRLIKSYSRWVNDLILPAEDNLAVMLREYFK